MKIAFLHFHLRRGGVTSVLQKQVSVLSRFPQPPQLAVLSGTPASAPLGCPVLVVPSLDYDSFTDARAEDREPNAERLAADLERALVQAFPQGLDLIHLHNPLLCKNLALLGALHLLQKKGYPLLVQIHDLAEDFRPSVYEPHWPYLEGCDYAVINQRDRDNLMAAGLLADQVHLLPNPVSIPEEFSPRGAWQTEDRRGRRSILYPVRAIRRKNLGEALFLAHFLPKGTELTVTLPPTSPADLPVYEAWKRYARGAGLPVRFEAGATAGLEDLYRQAFRVVSTSVKEGFGYSFLDPLVRGIPVVGRELPVVEDFRRQGLSFEHLYGAIPIPRADIPSRKLEEWIAQVLDRLEQGYEPAFRHDSRVWDRIREGLQTRFAGDLVDFGALDEELQTMLLVRMGADPGFKAALGRESPWLEGLVLPGDCENRAWEQRRTISEQFSEDLYGGRLLSVYEKALRSRLRGRIDRALLTERYLRAEAFYGVGL